ncbi:unnamed protein product [Microthlaspi erraticum]|uniref:Uncharacterized protein n=1 Tax=Microthlaspi erraticum TaxID=1685480 RepID=A0A6D2LR10_9BRAS|nr:unnamed protein product [Microthlaspi erraticum]
MENLNLKSSRVQLLFNKNLIAAQEIQPFSLTKTEARLEPIHLISLIPNSLPVKDEMELQRQVENNKVVYEVEGTFKVKAYFGFLHFSSTLVGRCVIEMVSPPTRSTPFYLNLVVLCMFDI